MGMHCPSKQRQDSMASFIYYLLKELIIKALMGISASITVPARCHYTAIYLAPGLWPLYKMYEHISLLQSICLAFVRRTPQLFQALGSCSYLHFSDVKMHQSALQAFIAPCYCPHYFDGITNHVSHCDI